MLCLLLEKDGLKGDIARSLRAGGHRVFASLTMDDLLDALWYHGSDVDFIVIEQVGAHDLDEFYETMGDWPGIEAFLFETKDRYPVIGNVKLLKQACTAADLLRLIGA